MHGLINRALEDFLGTTYGAPVWRSIAEELELGLESFEPMFIYDDTVTRRIIAQASENLGKPAEDLFEDFGTYLVANPNSERVRRLLRFGGVDFLDFLHSLEDLRGRARLAVSDLDLPALRLSEEGEGVFIVTCKSAFEGFGHVLLGVLRAIADDYGALVFVEHQGRAGDCDTLSVFLLDAAHSEGRDFSLTQEAS